MRRVYLPLIATTVVVGLVRLFVLIRIEYPGQAAWHWRYLLVDADVFRRYVSMMFLPTGQALFHEVRALNSIWQPRALLDLAIVLAVAAGAWRLRRASGVASVGIAWFMFLLVPSSVLIAFDQGEPMTEHRVYLASVGMFLAAAAGMQTIAGRLANRPLALRAGALVAFCAVVVSFVADTRLRNEVWSSPIGLWRESVELAPTHPRPRLLLAESLQDAGRWDEAVEQSRIAVELRPSDPEAHVVLGRSLALSGRWKEARRHLHDALEIDPANGPARRAVARMDEVERQSAIK